MQAMGAAKLIRRWPPIALLSSVCTPHTVARSDTEQTATLLLLHLQQSQASSDDALVRAQIDLTELRSVGEI